MPTPRDNIGLNCYSHRLPTLTIFATDTLNIESENQAKHIPVIPPSFPIEILGKSVQGFQSHDRTSKQTEITTLCGGRQLYQCNEDDFLFQF